MKWLFVLHIVVYSVLYYIYGGFEEGSFWLFIYIMAITYFFENKIWETFRDCVKDLSEKRDIDREIITDLNRRIILLERKTCSKPCYSDIDEITGARWLVEKDKES
jgi:hypothetical protein